MKTDATRLRQMFDRSSGLCHVCGVLVHLGTLR